MSKSIMEYKDSITPIEKDKLFEWLKNDDDTINRFQTRATDILWQKDYGFPTERERHRIFITIPMKDGYMSHHGRVCISFDKYKIGVVQERFIGNEEIPSFSDPPALHIFGYKGKLIRRKVLHIKLWIEETTS